MKRNSLTTAILAGLTGVAGMASVANAVNVNPDGLGQVLLYPYYTARGDNDTLISVVNTTNEVKAVKVRFIEALNSREVLDFNLYLSPFDVWVAGVTELDGGVPGIRTFDTSCTVPYFQGGTPGDAGEQEFLDFQYNSGDRFDLGPTGIERAASGYIELIEMGEVNNSLSPYASAATHTSAGVPRSGPGFGAPCDVLEAAWAPGGDWDQNNNDGITSVTGGLFGAGSIINVDEGTLISYNATAIDGFWEAGTVFHTDPGNLFPNLNQGATTSRVFHNGAVDEQTWGFGALAVNAALTYDLIYNEYVVDPDVGAASEWVMTFPTKRFHVDRVFPGGPQTPGGYPVAPFTDLWGLNASGTALSPACENFDFDFWNREEQEVTGDVGVSPRPPSSGFLLCREANVIRFGHAGAPDQTEILKEVQRPGNLGYTNFTLPSSFTAGWVRFDLGLDRSTGGSRLSEAAASGDQYRGLPVIGFWANTVTSDNVQDGVLSNYGAAYQHRGSRHIVRS